MSNKKKYLSKRLGSIFLAAGIAVTSFSIPVFATSDAINLADADASENRVVAFKGAEGGGMYTSGARGAYDNNEKIEVYHVTNLNDSGEGSFRDAVSKGNRIVVFDVSGNIDLSRNVSIGNDNITILGQTAPGDGVCFRSNNIKVGANNVILRYLRFRVGSKLPDGSDTKTQDGLEVTDDCQNVIIDHCSVSWGTDENFTAYAVKDATIQWSIIAEALNQSVHEKGEHSYAGIWGGVNLSVHHNVVATHKSRNPKVGTSETTAMTAGYTDDKTLVDMKNNIIYNWGDKSGYGTENGAKTYLQNNIYKPGPATPKGKRSRIFELSIGNKIKPNMFGSVYAVGNIIDVDPSDSDYVNAQKVNQDNWQDDLHTGVYTDTKFYAIGDKSEIKITTPNEDYQEYDKNYPITLDPTEEVFELVLGNAGATLPTRDRVDLRVLSNVRNRTAPTGSKGSIGLLDDPIDGVPAGEENLYDDRGYPILAEETRVAGFDTDGDGIPDEWEDKMGLNKANKNDGTNIGPDGLTWLEIYVEEAITKTDVDDLNLTLSEYSKVYKNNEEVPFSVNISGDGAGQVKEVEFYCNDEVVATTNQVSGGTATAVVSNIKSGDNSVVAKVIKNDGSYVISHITKLNVVGHEQVSDWTANSAVSLDGTDYVLLNESGSESGYVYKTITTDFQIATKIDSISNLHSGVFTGLKAESNNNAGDIFIGKMYDSNYSEVVCYRIGNAEYQIWKSGNNASNYNLFKISGEGNKLILSAAKTLAEWDVVAEIDISSVSDYNYGAVVTGDGTTVSKLSMLAFVTEESSPSAEIVNVSKNDRLGFNEVIDVKVSPDKGKKIIEVWFYLNGEPIASQEVDVTKEQVVSIPVKFTTPQKATLSVYCFDENLGVGNQSIDVSISQDPNPWIIDDIGFGSEDDKTFVLATDDYTYKITSDTDGKIGGTSDKFGYLYQNFVGDNRIYYRSRMQSGKQFGVAIKNDLSANGVTYYFGGNVDSEGNLKYQLMARQGVSKELTVVEDITSEIGSSKNLFFITEKAGDTINIYKTENSSTVFKTKTLLTSVKCDGIGDEYYMGFATVSGNGDPSDSGWVATEAFSSQNDETYIKDYKDGVVTINKGSNFESGTIIACGYEDGVLVDQKFADVVDTETMVGIVSGSEYKVFLWNNMTDMIPLCKDFDKSSVTGDSEITEWNFNYGLDWLWQIQQVDILRPSWTDEEIGNNSTGKMKISTQSDYNTELYTFREYVVPDTTARVFKANTDVLLAGDETGLNVYLQVKSGDTSFKVTFAEDGTVYFGDNSTGFTYDRASWYNIEYVCDTGKDANLAKIILRDSAGNICAEIDEVPSVKFRTQNNVEKKHEISNAIYFEPIVGIAANYYIDNVTVSQSLSSIQKVIVDSKMWNFGEHSGFKSYLNAKVPVGAIDGLTVTTSCDLQTNAKTIDGIGFPARLKIGGPGSKTSRSVKFNVPKGTTDIIVYGENSGSTGVRSIVINDGTENKTVVNTQMSVKHTYQGDATTIYVYGDAGVSLYGVKYETYTLE